MPITAPEQGAICAPPDAARTSDGVQPSCGLEAVIITPELDRRGHRAPDTETETRVLLSLTAAVAKSPAEFFPQLNDATIQLCHAQSAGVSLLNVAEHRFIWPAISGPWKSYIGGGTPQEFGPCGVVMERNQVMLFSRPQRYYPYLDAGVPALEEVLLAPFHIDGHVVGTVWAVAHSKDHLFDNEDRRLLKNLSQFAAGAYRSLLMIGALEPLLISKQS